MFLISKLSTLSLKKLFLIDALGALLTAFMLGYVQTTFSTYFGMPLSTLRFLAVFAVILSIFSFVCFFRLNKNWQPYLKSIAILNIAYCLITLYFIYTHYSELTKLGFSYFILEILIIITLAITEFKKTYK